MALAMGRATVGRQHADADEDGDGTQADQLDGGLGQSQRERGDAEDGDDACR